MITRHGLFMDDFKARFYDIQLGKPDTKEPVVLTEQRLAEWDDRATEVVKCETLDYAEWYCETEEGDAQFPLNILRIQHEDGTFSVEPVYKLFPIEKKHHPFLRNTLLCYCDVEWDLQESIDIYEMTKNAPIRKLIPDFPVTIRDLWYIRNLQMMYARKYDINMVQAMYRTVGWMPENWIKEFDGKFDYDLCWLWHC